MDSTLCRPPYWPASESLLYFLGRHLTQADFTDSDHYPISQLRAHHWMLHGWGILTGLKVEAHRPDCPEWVIVQPGAALDPYGRLIVLEKPAYVHVAELRECAAITGHDDEEGAAGCCGGEKQQGSDVPNAETPKEEAFFLCLHYLAKRIKDVPVIVPSDKPARCRPGRIQDSHGFCRATMEPACDECGGLVNQYPPQRSVPPCDEEQDLPFRPLYPFKGPWPVVPLAHIKRVDGKLEICHKRARKYLPGPLHPTTLTHICDNNWTHGSKQRLDHFKAGNEYAFYVEFNGLICPENFKSDDDGLVNVFHVYFTLSGPDFERHYIRPDRVTLESERKKLYFWFSKKDCNAQKLFDEKRDAVVHLSVLCDFLLDECGRAVDGNHLGGRMKTGNGTEGGTFESWFTLTPATTA